jgi:lipoate-protein ligase A
VQHDVATAPAYPREVLAWSTEFYASALAPVLAPGAPAFGLQEHDYCLGDVKIGGNAQSISRDRWVHHTSFLWDFTDANMALLRLPDKRPAYRQDRPHGSFLTRLRQHVVPPQPGTFFQAVRQGLAARFDVVDTPVEEALHVLQTSQERQGSHQLQLA